MKYSEAKDVMFDTIHKIVFPVAVEKRYQGQEYNEPPKGYWLRVSSLMADEEQATLSEDVGSPGQKRYNSAGLLFVQMFAAKQEPSSDRTLLMLSETVQSVLRQANGKRCVTFRNVRINDLAPEDQFYRYNVIAEFEFDQIA